VIVASSSSVYGDPPLPFREDDPCKPTNTYGVTKYAQELITLNWAKGVNVEAAALRFFNVYGPGSNMENRKTGVLAKFAREILAGRSPKVTQDGLQTRDFIYVQDIAEAVCRIAMKESTLQHDVYNVCTGIPTTMAAAAWKLAKALGTQIEPEITGACRVGDQQHVLGINNRLRAEIEWAPRTFDQGVEDYASRLLYER
jgi:dTDP-L-rhamnose 4-epimerase